MGKIIRRLFELDLPEGQSAFLWGPRRVGKTYWITHHLPEVPVIDLLKSDVYADYASRPALLRERYADHQGLVVVDEIQKVPSLLDEIHWLIEHKGPAFLLTGSSARKLRREHANLLAGRAWRRTMVPLSCLEVDSLDMERVMISGLLPPHFLSQDPLEDLRAYVGDYLKEEVAAEARIRNIPAFAEFLRVAAITSSELVNYTNVARESGISQKTVRQYFEILDDTLLGIQIPPWRKSKNRRMIQTQKSYLFDVGVANFLARRQPRRGTPEFGKAFEHYVLMELRAFQSYRQPDMPIAFWRTSTGHEVDFILGDRETAVEVKGAERVHSADLRGLRALREDGPVGARVVVCLESEPRRTDDGIEILPAGDFVEKLWNGAYVR